MEELQQRHEQLEMMMKWQESLRDLKQDVISRLCDYWHELAPGYVPNDNGKNNLKKWLRNFSVEEIMAAMAISAEAYIEYKDDDSVTSESWEKAFAKIPGICRVERASKEDPELKDLYYIRGIARNRYVSRPSLVKIFRGQKAKAQRDRSIRAAHVSHGYTLKEIADYLRIHYTTVSKVIAKAGVSKK